MQIKGPFVKAMLFDRTLLNFNCPLLNQKIEIGTFSDSFRFHNIHISDQAQFAMINMPIKWHHIGIFNKNCSLFDMFKMVFGSLFLF
jgi:hypothetical protein